jgi:cytochrome c
MIQWIAMGLLLAAGTIATARAQLPFEVPKPAAPVGGDLFTGQCGTCHATERGAPPRQGPNLAGVFQRKAGSSPGFHYSTGLGQAGFVWDEAHLGAWLSNPQKLVPGAVMAYRQPNPAIRASIIAWLKEQH